MNCLGSELSRIGQTIQYYFQTGSGPASLLSRNPSSLYLSRVIKMLLFAYAKTKAQISCAINAQLINGFLLAT